MLNFLSDKSLKELSTCEYEAGDGVAKEKSYIGFAAGKRDCALKCFDKSRVDPDINGATFDIDKKKWCWCQHELTGVDTAGDKGTKFATCKMKFVKNHEGTYRF